MILILGGNGFIGYNLVKRFAQREKLRIFDREWKHQIENENIELITGDFQDADFEAILKEVDTVFHFISSSIPFDGTEKLLTDIMENVLPTVRLLDAMKKKNVKKIFFISSGGTIYGECMKPARESDKNSPECVYALQKVWIENCLHLYDKYDGIQSYILRIGNPYGLDINRKKHQGIISIFVENIINEKPIEVWGTGENQRDYIYIDEVIDAIEAVYLYKGMHRIFNIGTGNSYFVREIIEKIEREVGKQAQITYGKARKCDLMKSYLDVSLIRKECGWYSKLTVDQGIRIYIDKLMKQ